MATSVASITMAFNAAHLLPRQLEALLSQKLALQEVIVVDNGSTDGTKELLAERYPQVTVLRLEKNQGAAGAWAAGLAYAALERRHDWVWTLDDDSVPEEDTLAQLLGAVASLEEGKGEVGIAAPLCVNPETGRCHPPLRWDQGFVKPSADMLKGPIWFADLVFTSGSLVRSDVVRTIGLPRVDFFMDFFDFEYCLRARSHNYKIAVVTQSRLMHELGAGRNIHFFGYKALWPDRAPWREYYIARNLTYSAWWLYPSRGVKRFAVRHLARHAGGVMLFGSNKLLCLARIAQGFQDGLRARLGIRFRPEPVQAPS